MKHKLLITTLGLSLMGASAYAKDIKVETLKLAGPYNVMKPAIIDSVSTDQTKLGDDYVIKTQVNLNPTWTSSQQDSITNLEKGKLYLTGFTFNTTTYQEVGFNVKGAKASKVYVGGNEASGKFTAQPGQYDVVVKFVADTANVKISIDADSVKTAILSSKPSSLIPNPSSKRPYTLADNMLLKHYSGVRVSPSGKLAILSTSGYNTQGTLEYKTSIINAQTGKKLAELPGWVNWMPKQDRYLLNRKVEDKTQIVSIDPLTLDEKILCYDLPDDSYFMSPTEDFIIISKSEKGPKKEDGVYEIRSMEDRQPGWRDRTSLAKMDLNTGLVQPLTFGHKNLWANAVSEDGKYLFFSTFENTPGKRPTEHTSVMKMNLETLAVDTIINNDGFIAGTTYVPGTNKLLVVGSAEAFNGIGRNLPDNMTPNVYEHQLFVVDIDTKAVTPVAKDFNPSVNDAWSNGLDGYAYFTAENQDSVSLYRLNLKTNKIDMINQPCEVISNMSIASRAGTLLYYGTGACTSDKLYTMNLKNLKSAIIDDINKERLADVALGTCEAWSFKSERGYELTGHAYLPANFDKTKKYPMIVHYYGGCSPTSRRFGNGSHYPAHYWNALGYVVLIVNPSGAAGFGQEWGARHVNTAGEGPAQDIIEATKWYCKHNTAVNDKKIGCVSASYGGFMTQWILTKTDMFACGISHAGISDHTSYWGEGYWGYTYSEVSMANSYPWTRKDLYVDCSPLFNAEKIHTPLLFTHGTKDTNVPIGESIQMYTALKLLGCPTAFVMVEGENHGIMDYHKRQKWINTMVAWFQKYLQDDDSWWKGIYKEEAL